MKFLIDPLYHYPCTSYGHECKELNFEWILNYNAIEIGNQYSAYYKKPDNS